MNQFMPWLAILYFVCLWSFVGWLLGGLTGWRFVAKVYPHEGPLPSKHRWNFCSIPNRSFRNCVHVSVDEKGMYFQLWYFFRIGNPSIFVPWSDVQGTPTKFLFMPTMKLTFRKTPNMPFHFDFGIANEFAKAANSRWPQAQRDNGT